MKTSKRKSIRHAGFTIRKRRSASGAESWRLERWEGGRLVRTTFATLEAAKGEAERLADEVQRVGRQAYELTADQKADAVKALTKLAGHATLEAAADCWLRYYRPPKDAVTFASLVEKYAVEAKARNLRHRSLTDIRARLARLAKDMGTVPALALDTATIENWLDAQSLSPANRRNFRTVIHGLFAWAAREKIIPDNPAAGLRRVKVETGMPAIITPAQVQAALLAAEKVEPRLVPYLALAFFAGIRPAELVRLTWGDVDLASGTVTIRPEYAKKRRARIIAMADNCRKWLTAFRPFPADPTAGIVPSESTCRKWFTKVRKAAAIPAWPADVARHCFGTYHLALHADISKTCLDMGHTSPNVLFEHYRNLSTKEQAAAFFDIVPAADVGVIRFETSQSTPVSAPAGA